MERAADELLRTAETVPGVRSTCCATALSVTAERFFLGSVDFGADIGDSGFPLSSWALGVVTHQLPLQKRSALPRRFYPCMNNSASESWKKRLEERASGTRKGKKESREKCKCLRRGAQGEGSNSMKTQE